MSQEEIIDKMFERLSAVRRAIDYPNSNNTHSQFKSDWK